MKKYKIIYADPPWEYKRKADTKIKGGAIRHYPTMNLEDIKKLPIKNISDENCALFMWCTFPKLKEQLEVFEDWGFKYKTVAFNWVKLNPNCKDRLFLTKKDRFFGIGYYTKSNAEICLLGIKGKMKPISNKVSSIILEPRGRHSEKPDIVRDRIIELYGDIPKIELFARKKNSGWDSFGNEVDNSIELKEA
jgi:site-specific DNA-methyltransferase (adenine-specific)